MSKGFGNHSCLSETCSNEKRALASRLREEVDLSRPEFSQALHDRICAALRTRQPEVKVRSRPFWKVRGWAYAAMTAVSVAGVILAAGRVFWRTVPEPSTTDPAVAAIEPSVPGDEQVAADHRTRLGAFVESTLAINQWASLDHDAHTAAKLLLDQLPLELASPKKP